METQELLHSIMSMLIEAMDIEVVIAEGVVPKFVREAEGVSLEVEEVLAKAPKSPRMPILKTTPTKESAKDNKGKQVVIWCMRRLEKTHRRTSPPHRKREKLLT